MNKKLKVTERENLVLCLLLENKVMTRRQIANHVFPGLDKGNLSHRLNRVLNLGLVKDYLDRRLDKYDILYELSGEGVAYAKSIYSMEFDQSPARSYAYEHDVGLVNLRRLFQNKPSVKKYISENILQCCPVVRDSASYKSFSEMMSDAVIVFQAQTKLRTGALEFEPTAKWIERYRDKVLNYYVKSDIGFVLYVCTSETTIQAIRTIENAIKPEGATKIYFSLLENVLAAKDKVIFEGRNQATIEIN